MHRTPDHPDTTPDHEPGNPLPVPDPDPAPGDSGRAVDSPPVNPNG